MNKPVYMILYERIIIFHSREIVNVDCFSCHRIIEYNTHRFIRNSYLRDFIFARYFRTMGINLGDEFPNFEADTTEGKIKFHDWIGDSWCILFSHPNDFTPVCTTELGRVADLIPEFEKRKIKVIALSCNSVESHNEWIKDIQSYSKCAGEKFPYPIISDPKRELAVKLGMLDPEEKDSDGLPLTCRAVFVIDSNKKLKLSILYPATTGRNFNELLRAVDSLFLADKKKVATPADWKVGDDCMILPGVPQEEVPTLFPKGHKIIEVPSKKAYIRITPQP